MKRTKICDIFDPALIGSEVCVNGWVRTMRQSKTFAFVELNDGSYFRNLQIILDPVNLLDHCNYKDQVAIVDEAIDLLGEDVAMVHLKDFIPEDGKLRSVGCGLGQMDYTSVLKFMKERKPFIHATLEDTTPENNVQVKNFIQGLYDNL